MIYYFFSWASLLQSLPVCPAFILPSFMSTINQVSISFIWCRQMLFNFVRRPGFKPVTTGLSGKIHTHLTMAPSTWFRESLYGICNGDDHWKGHQIRAWLSYMSWSLFCRHFVDIEQSFSWHFRIRDGNDFSQFGQTEVNATQGYAISQYKLCIHYFTRYADANKLSRGLYLFHCTLYVIICRRQIARPHHI